MTPQAITVQLADAPTDVLVYLVDHGPGTIRDIAHAVAPPDHPMPGTVTKSALGLLLRFDCVQSDAGVWSATDAGREAVRAARTTA